MITGYLCVYRIETGEQAGQVRWAIFETHGAAQNKAYFHPASVVHGCWSYDEATLKQFVDAFKTKLEQATSPTASE